MRPLTSNLFLRLGFFLLTVLVACPAWAEDNTLNVQCADQAGAPIKDVQVRIQHLQTGKWKDKKSDAKGTAAFNKLDDGVYRVIARKDGLAPAFYEFVLLKNAAQQSVPLKFQPGDPKSPVYFED